MEQTDFCVDGGRRASRSAGRVCGTWCVSYYMARRTVKINKISSRGRWTYPKDEVPMDITQSWSSIHVRTPSQWNMGRTDLSSRNKKNKAVSTHSTSLDDRSRRYIQHHLYPSSHFPARPFYLELLRSIGPPNSEANWHENGVLTIFRCFLDGFWAVWRLVERSKSANRRIGIRMWLIEIQRHSRA